MSEHKEKLSLISTLQKIEGNFDFRHLNLLFDCSDAAFIHPDDLVIGENISPFPEVKLTFEGFGDLETENEDGEYIYEEGGTCRNFNKSLKNIR